MPTAGRWGIRCGTFDVLQASRCDEESTSPTSLCLTVFKVFTRSYIALSCPRGQTIPTPHAPAATSGSRSIPPIRMRVPGGRSTGIRVRYLAR